MDIVHLSAARHQGRGREVAGMPLHLQPQPPRSDDHPGGVPSLSEKEQAFG